MSELVQEVGEVVVLFSGGRDSSLTTCLLAKDGATVHMLSTFNGAVVQTDIVEIRYSEIKLLFGEQIVNRTVIPSYGLFRKVALKDIEQDFKTYHYNLIPLGDAIATHTIAVIYCLRNNIKTVASGYTSYQSSFPEQFPEAIELTRNFLAEYGISYLTPVLGYGSVDEVKYRLFDFGISTKSYEGVSLFADTFSTPTPEVVTGYIKSKLELCRQYIASMVPKQ
jgi:7-cyano-7-deazaguanine synthase in queuosine biosynthesis